MAKLDLEPRLTSVGRDVIEWARSVARNFNSMVDAIGGNGSPRSGTSSITDTLDGPAFSAYLSANSDWVSGNFNELALNAELFDTASAFDITTGKFQPKVAGYYQICGSVSLISTTSGATLTNAQAHIFLNGASYKSGEVEFGATSPPQVLGLGVSALVPMNGTTDYVRLASYLSTSAGNPRARGGTGAETWITGYLARRA